MEQSKILWRDWDWYCGYDNGDGDLEPFALDRPGQLIFCPADLFAAWRVSRPRAVAEYQAWSALETFHALALLNQQHRFLLLTNDPGAAREYYAHDLAPVGIQRRAGQILGYASQAGARYLPRRRFGLAEERMTAEEAYGEGARAVQGADFAALQWPKWRPWLENVWLGYRPASRDTGEAGLRVFVDIPAALRWLYIPATRPYEFASRVWGEEFVPVPAPAKGQGWKDFENREPPSCDLIETKSMPVRKIHWTVCGAGSDTAAEYVAAQCVESGVPLWIEGAAGYSRHDLALQYWPVEAERAPILTPQLARSLEARGQRDGKGYW